MKRLIAALVILAVTVLVATLPSLYTNMACDRMTKQTEQILSRPDTESAEEIAALWDGYERKMRFYVSHNDLEQVTELIGLLPAVVTSGSETLMEALCASIDGQLEHIRESERAELGNIF